MFGRCLWTETPPHKKVGRHKSQKTNSWNQKITPTMKRNIIWTKPFISLFCHVSIFFLCAMFIRGVYQKLLLKSQPLNRQWGEESTLLREPFPWRLMMGPLKNSLMIFLWVTGTPMIRLSCATDSLRVGWLGWLVGWLVGWLCCLGVEHGGYRNDKKCGDGEFSENLWSWKNTRVLGEMVFFWRLLSNPKTNLTCTTCRWLWLEQKLARFTNRDLFGNNDIIAMKVTDPRTWINRIHTRTMGWHFPYHPCLIYLLVPTFGGFLW